MSKRPHFLLAMLVVLVLPATALAADGDPEPGFNAGQPAILHGTATATDATELSHVVVDGAGRALTGGDVLPSGGTPEALIARLSSAGILDGSFGSGGIAVHQYGATYSTVVGLSAISGGALLAGLTADPGSKNSMLTLSTDAAGQPAAGYGTAGIGTRVQDGTARWSEVHELRLQDGSALFGAISGTSLVLARIGADGTPLGATVTDTPFAGVSPHLAALAQQPDGHVLVLGTGNDAGGTPAMVVARYTPSLARDSSFGANGVAVVQAATGTGATSAGGMAVAPDGSIFVGGTVSTSTSGAPALAKLTATGQAAPGFTTYVGGLALHSVGSVAAVLLMSDGRILTVENRTVEAGVPRGIIERFTSSGALDPTWPAVAVLAGGATHLTDGALDAYSTTVTVSGTTGGGGVVARYILRTASELHAPQNTAPPKLTGIPSPGQTLTCQAGTWTNSPTLTYVWERAPRSTSSPTDQAWQPIGGSTQGTYVVQASDVGSRVRCHEIATNGDGSAAAPSNSLRADAGVPSQTRAASVAGTPKVGSTLICDPGTWDNEPDFRFQWTRNGAPIDGATGAQYVPGALDDEAMIGCAITASNDVGSSPASAPGEEIFSGVPIGRTQPEVTITRTGSGPTDFSVTCSPGAWFNDGHQYAYAWYADGAVIGGAVTGTLPVTASQIGRRLSCGVTDTNVLGTGAERRSNEKLLPLPGGSDQDGEIFEVVGKNQFDPTNLLALTNKQLAAYQGVTVSRLNTAIAALRQSCAGRTGLPTLQSVQDSSSEQLPQFGPDKLTDDETCTILNSGQQVSTNVNGAFWVHGDCPQVRRINPPPGGKGPKQQRAAPGYTPVVCGQLSVVLPQIDPARPPALSPDEQTTLKAAQPQEVLWDLNGDGHVDATCGPDAPVLRSLYQRGNYVPQAVAVSTAPDGTITYSRMQTVMSVHPTAANPNANGTLRDAQPFVCRTGIDPPPEPNLPCATEGQIGRVHVTGNLCPITLRDIPQAEIDAMPPDLQNLLEDRALNSGLRAAIRGARTRAAASIPPPTSLAYQAALDENAIAQFQSDSGAYLTSSVEKALDALPHVDAQKGAFALDQIYGVVGDMTVNGVHLDPQKAAETILVPGDAGEAVDDVKDMIVASSDVQPTLGGVPIGNPKALAQSFSDSVKGQAETLVSGSLDNLKNELKDKLDLGPFSLAGDAQVKLDDDGSAEIDAQASLPILLGSPTSGPIRTAVRVHADPDGSLHLEGLHLEIPSAYLGFLEVSNAVADYGPSGLDLKGQILLPTGSGIDVKDFRITNRGTLGALDVDFLAGAGQGVPVGPGIFITRLGGGFTENPDEIHADTSLSIGPSAGGGCPVAGIDAGFRIHFGPPPFALDANGDLVLACIPLLKVVFHADADGHVHLGADIDLDAGPLYLSATILGDVDPNLGWQVSFDGSGGIRHIISATIKGLIGSRGVAACGRIDTFFGSLAAGAGEHFPNGKIPTSFSALVDNFEVFFGCDLSSFSFNGRDVRAVGVSGRTLTVPPNAGKAVAVSLTGAGGVPKVTLTSPDGKTYDLTSVGDYGPVAGIDAAALPETDRLVAFIPATAGAWTITPAPGTPAIAAVQEAHILPPPSVTATVGGIGTSRILHWHVAEIPGQVVRFYELERTGERAIATVKTGGSGHASFLVSEARTGKRKIVAEVLQDDHPRANLTVAHFSAPLVTAGTPRHVRVRRAGRHSLVTWSRAPYAARYDVLLTTSTGVRRLYHASARSHRAAMAAVAKTAGAKVQVAAVTQGGLRSHPGMATLTKAGRGRGRPR